MAKIIRNENLPKEINVVVNGKIIAKAIFDDNNIYETDDKNVIRELKEYGYDVVESGKSARLDEEPREVERPRTRRSRGLD